MIPVFDPLLARGFDAAFSLVTRAGLAGVSCPIPESLVASLPKDRPVLLYGNHASNWDGFLYRRLQRALRPGAPIYSVMLESELRHFPLFRRLGGIGLDPASPASALRVLRTLRALRVLRADPSRRPDFFVTVFPQGTTMPVTQRPLQFREGVRAFARALGPVTLLPVALRYELLGSLRPRAFVRVGEALPCDPDSDAGIPELPELEARVIALLDRLDADLCRGGESFARGETP
jgi:1-acyl-sn-glycerol-3-phosphate acyltransferase